MHKIVAVAIVCGGVTICYLLMLVVMPVLTQFASTANLTMAASGADLTAHPGATEGLLAAPWVLWFVPGAIGIVIIVGILKSP